MTHEHDTTGEVRVVRHPDEVYDIPDGTDLGTLRSVAIWCKRFAVSFGAAALA